MTTVPCQSLSHRYFLKQPMSLTWSLPSGNNYPNCSGSLNRNLVLPCFSSPFLSQKKEICPASSYHNLVSVYFIPWSILKNSFQLPIWQDHFHWFHQQAGLNDQVERGQRKPKQCIQYIPSLLSLPGRQLNTHSSEPAACWLSPDILPLSYASQAPKVGTN